MFSNKNTYWWWRNSRPEKVVRSKPYMYYLHYPKRNMEACRTYGRSLFYTLFPRTNKRTKIQMKMKTYHVNEEGYYGNFGGAYVPEILYKTVEDLRKAYLPILESEAFRKEYHALLKDYVAAPRPLYHARRLSEKYGCKLYLKREDLNHTGAHKIQ